MSSMFRRHLRADRELHPQIRPQLEGTLDQPGFKRTPNELRVFGSLAEAEISNRNGCDLEDLFLAEQREPAVRKRFLGGLVELDIVIT